MAKSTFDLWGSYFLIAHVLQSMPIYLMYAMNPPKGIINQIHKIMAKNFWGHIGVKWIH